MGRIILAVICFVCSYFFGISFASYYHSYGKNLFIWNRTPDSFFNYFLNILPIVVIFLVLAAATLLFWNIAVVISKKYVLLNMQNEKLQGKIETMIHSLLGLIILLGAGLCFVFIKIFLQELEINLTFAITVAWHIFLIFLLRRHKHKLITLLQS